MKKLIIAFSFLMGLLGCFKTMVVAQDAHRIPLNRTLQVEVPLEYTFKAGIESVRKTVTVRLEIKDFMVLHKPLKQFIEGGAMGIMYDEVNVTRWYSYTSPDGLFVDNEFVPFSNFSDDPTSFQVQNVRFTWTQGASRYATLDMGSPYLSMVPKSETPGYTFDIYNLSQIVGTETGKEAFDIVKGKGEIVGAFLQAGGISYRPPYQLERYLSERDARIAQETGYYTTNGSRNQVKTNDVIQQKEQEKLNNQAETNGTSSGVAGNNEMVAGEEGNNQTSNLATENNDGNAEKDSPAVNSPSRENQTSQQQVEEWQKNFDNAITQGERDREKKREQYDQLAETGAVAAVALAGVLNEVVPEATFGMGTFTYSRSKFGNKYFLQAGCGYKLTPKGTPNNVALAANLVLGAYQSDANWEIYQREIGSDYSELAEFESLKTQLMIGLGGSLYFDIPAWKRKAINFSGSWVYGGLSFSDDAELFYVPIEDSQKDHFEMITYKLEFIHFFSKNYGLALGVGYEKNKGIYHDNLGRSERIINGLMFSIGLTSM